MLDSSAEAGSCSSVIAYLVLMAVNIIKVVVYEKLYLVNLSGEHMLFLTGSRFEFENVVCNVQKDSFILSFLSFA